MTDKILENKQDKQISLSDLLATRFTGKDNYDRPKMDFVNKLLTMNDNDLQKQCERFIWLSAYANNNPRSDYHWQCDACYDVCAKQNKENIYKQAYDVVAKGC